MRTESHPDTFLTDEENWINVMTEDREGTRTAQSNRIYFTGGTIESEVDYKGNTPSSDDAADHLVDHVLGSVVRATYERVNVLNALITRTWTAETEAMSDGPTRYTTATIMKINGQRLRVTLTFKLNVVLPNYMLVMIAQEILSDITGCMLHSLDPVVFDQVDDLLGQTARTAGSVGDLSDLLFGGKAAGMGRRS